MLLPGGQHLARDGAELVLGREVPLGKGEGDLSIISPRDEDPAVGKRCQGMVKAAHPETAPGWEDLVSGGVVKGRRVEGRLEV